jgi:hypothetical protein
VAVPETPSLLLLPHTRYNQVAIIITASMEASSICCLVLALQIVSLVSAASRPFAPNSGVAVNRAGICCLTDDPFETKRVLFLTIVIVSSDFVSLAVYPIY